LLVINLKCSGQMELRLYRADNNILAKKMHLKFVYTPLLNFWNTLKYYIINLKKSFSYVGATYKDYLP
jgi:hypothetical protein